MSFWYFHGQYKANVLGNNKIAACNTFDLRYVIKVAAEEEKNVYIFIQLSKQRKWKNILKTRPQSRT